MDNTRDEAKTIWLNLRPR